MSPEDKEQMYALVGSMSAKQYEMGYASALQDVYGILQNLGTKVDRYAKPNFSDHLLGEYAVEAITNAKKQSIERYVNALIDELQKLHK